MRTEKELFELMLTRQDLFETGICLWADYLSIEDLITYDEYGLLANYLKSNSLKDEGYWWKEGQIEPRIKWIKQQIEKL
jgi:hypothetical protein